MIFETLEWIEKLSDFVHLDMGGTIIKSFEAIMGITYIGPLHRTTHPPSLKHCLIFILLTLERVAFSRLFYTSRKMMICVDWKSLFASII